jgi:hypothetical protein
MTLLHGYKNTLFRLTKMLVIYFEPLCFFRYPSSSGVCTNQTYNFANCEISQMLRDTYYNKIVPVTVPQVANK